MISYIWPIALVVVSNILYQICSKSVPGNIDPMASLTVTYFVATAASVVFYYILNRHGSLLREYRNLNWAPFVLGLVIVGLEVGFICAYRAGWQVSAASVVQSAFLSIALIGVGALLYHEPVTWNRIVGIGLCLAGLVFINQ